MNKKNILVIINGSYPFDQGEAFMENEIPLIDQFDKVIICPCNVVDFNKKRNVKNNIVTIYPISKSGKLVKIFNYIKAFFFKETIDDLLFLYKNKNLNIKTLKELLSFV
ncbi:MAG: hypothetical protein RSF67_08285, partial [Clostridia bacterium]